MKMIENYINSSNFDEKKIILLNSKFNKLFNNYTQINANVYDFVAIDYSLLDHNEDLLFKDIEFLCIENLPSNLLDEILFKYNKFSKVCYDNVDLLLENKSIRSNYIDETGCWLNNNNNDHVFDEILANEIAKYCENKNVVDFGCGNGSYVNFLNNKENINCIGYDGNPNISKYKNCFQQNLVKNFKIKKKFEVVICLEVGEHIPSIYENILINNITKCCSNLLILSWAIVGQDGFGHVNCKNNEEVIKLIENKGFTLCLEKTNNLRETCTTSWFKNTLMVFEKNDKS